MPRRPAGQFCSNRSLSKQELPGSVRSSIPRLKISFEVPEQDHWQKSITEVGRTTLLVKDARAFDERMHPRERTWLGIWRNILKPVSVS